jgi:hypothetical protein
MTLFRFSIGVSAIVLLEAAAHAQVLFHEDFNDNSAGWTLQNSWQIGAAQASTCSPGVGHDPPADADGKTGGGVAGTTIGGCVSNMSTWQYLVSPAIDTTGASNLRLQFDRCLALEIGSQWAGPNMAVIDVWNGGAWLQLFHTFPVSSPAWSHHSFDITGVSNANLRIRWGIYNYVNSSAGWTIDNVRITNDEYFFDRFSNNAAGWTLGPQWQIGNATASTGCATDVGFYDDPPYDADGTPAGGVAGVLLGGCLGSTAHPQYYLQSPTINASAASLLRLEFDRWLNSDMAGWMNSVIEVWNGTSWVTIFDTCCHLPADSSWTHFGYDLTAHKNAALKIRFGFSTTPAAYDVSGWNIDNLTIFDPAACYLTLSAYAGPGSVRVKARCVSAAAPPGTTLFNCFTFVQGAYPNGWFFGLDPSFADVLGQFTSGQPPFVAPTDSNGDFVWQLPAGVPAGIPLYAVTVAIGPGLYVLGNSSPVFFMTL